MSFGLYSQGQLQLQTNKKVYIPGEQVWFSAYFFDSLNEPIAGDFLLHTEVLGQDGNLKKEMTFLIQDGVASGNFKVEESWNSKSLFVYVEVLRSSTMSPPIQDGVKIFLLSEMEPSTVVEAKSSGTFFWSSHLGQVLPDEHNTLLFQLPFADVRLDFYQGSTPLYTDLKGSWKGMGQLTYYHDPDKDYKFVLTGSDHIPSYYPVKHDGRNAAGIQIDNLNEKEIKVGILEKQKRSNAQLELWLYGRSQWSVVKLTDNNEIYSLPRNGLKNGVFEIRYTVDGKIYGRNWLVNYQPETLKGLSLDYERISKDSIEVQLIKAQASKHYRLNATLMTRESYALFPFRDEKLHALLSKVFKRRELPAFNRLDSRSRRSRIDHWVRLHSETRIDSFNTLNLGEYVDGYFLQGRVSGVNSQKVEQVLIQSKKGAFALSPVDSYKKFKAKVFPYTGDILYATGLNSKGQAISNYDSEVWFKPIKPKLAPTALKEHMLNMEMKEDEEFLDLFVWPDDQIILEEVTVTAPKNRSTAFQITADLEGRVILEADAKNYPTLGTYLRRLGYSFKEDHTGVLGLYSRGVGPGNKWGPVPVFLVVDGLLSDNRQIFELPTSQIQSLVFDSMRRNFIAVNLKKGSKKVKSFELAVEQGLTPEDRFQRTLAFFNKNYLSKYGTLLWEPRIQWINGQSSRLFFDPIQEEEFVLVLRGLDEANQVIDTHIPISLPQP